jgi:hypothetical protein
VVTPDVNVVDGPTPGKVELVGGTAVRLGNSTTPGDEVSVSLVLPTDFPSGAVQWVQIISNLDVSFKRNDGICFEHTESGALDSKYPTTSGPAFSDSPAVPLASNQTSKCIQESFQTWLMYNPAPSASGTIWVPLKLLTWGWSATLTNGNGWVIVSPNVTKPSFNDSSVFPQWQSVNTGGVYSQLACGSVKCSLP